MSDVFIRNVDLMTHATLRRRNVNQQNVMLANRFSSLLWEDITLLNFTPTRIRQVPIARCTSLTIQISYQSLAAPLGAPWPIVTIRDGSVASNTPLTVVNGFELIPGDMISFESDDQEINSEIFIDPTEFYAFLNSVGTQLVHICYGILK